VALVCKETIPTERPPQIGEVSASFADRGCRVISATDRMAVNLDFLDPAANTKLEKIFLY
jgi:hypothetical protein